MNKSPAIENKVSDLREHNKGVLVQDGRQTSFASIIPLTIKRTPPFNGQKDRLENRAVAFVT